MFHIRVERVLKSDIDDVFAALADHANYKNFKGIEDSVLLEEGKEDKNGLGALREIKAAGGVLHERIVEYEVPHKLGYLIEYSKPLPYRHRLGQISLSKHEQGYETGTLVVWESKGHIAIPLLGKFYFDKQIQQGGSRAFASILKQIDARLQ